MKSNPAQIQNNKSKTPTSPKSMQIKQQTKDDTINVVFDTLALGKQALVFLPSKSSAEKTAETIAQKIKQTTKPGLADQIKKILPSPTKQCLRLAGCIEKGIAFHHAGLTQKQKELIEDNFRTGTVKIICCTPTLAAGVDLPSFRTILKSLKRFQSPRGMQWIPVLEYEQMAGRSGRPSFDTFGEAIALAKTDSEKDEIYDRYLCGVPENIYSKLAVEPVLRTYLLSLIAAGFVKDKKTILDFFNKTFWAHQFQDMQQLESIIDRMLLLLEEYEFISRGAGKKDDFMSAADLVKISENKITATILGKRVAQLYLDPLTAYQIIVSLRRATEKGRKCTDFSFLHLASNRLEMRPLLRVKVKEWEKYQEQVMQKENEVLEQEPDLYDPLYDEYVHSIKTALFFQEWCNEKQEDYLLEKYAIRPGEVKVKIDIADWILYSGEELAKLMKLHTLVKEIMKMRFRLKYGVKEELLPLLRLKGIGRVRARGLFNNGIRDIKEVKKADIVKLAQILGKKLAISVKQQVGQDYAPEKVIISEKKRKGQMSLMKY